jgi:lipid II isoglutaminyl synthase (glutamine-hydrolysing)
MYITMKHVCSILVGKSIRFASRMRGGGSALPGLIVEKTDKHFLKYMLGSLPRGVVVVSGTNGKTTSVKIVKELLESQGLRVFTNATGSNFKRGVISAIVEKSTLTGKLPYDIAVLELDEAHAQHFIADVSPDYCLLLNVMRDQLDRFGEIDATAKLLENIACKTKKRVVLNARDDRVRAIADHIDSERVTYFSYQDSLAAFFPSDDDLYNKTAKKSQKITAHAELISYVDDVMTMELDSKQLTSKIHVSGIYNVYNAVGAVALVSDILPELDVDALMAAVAAVRPAFGRGEQVVVNGQPLQLVLVKNPISFKLGILSYAAADDKTMIVINDQYADGRDMSWLWDVDFTPLGNKVAVVSGVRASDMALRLQYDDISTDAVESDIAAALDVFVTLEGKKTIFCTYTAMLQLRKLLDKHTDIERVL